MTKTKTFIVPAFKKDNKVMIVENNNFKTLDKCITEAIGNELKTIYFGKSSLENKNVHYTNKFIGNNPDDIKEHLKHIKITIEIL